MTREDFISAVSVVRGAPDAVQHFHGGVAMCYGSAVVTANDREISLNDGADFDRMVAVRLSHVRGWR